MALSEPMHVGYIVRRYPRYSETFIVREILAHEEAGVEIDIFSLRPPNDGHFQDVIARVRAPVHHLYLPADGLTAEELAAPLLKAADFWTVLQTCSQVLPGLWTALEAVQGEEARHVYQAALLARQVRLRGIRHLHAAFANEPATVARLAAHFAGVPYSFTARAKDIYLKSVRPNDLRRKLSDAAAVITVSDYNLEYLRKTYGPAAAQVQRIYNGLDLTEFAYATPEHRPPRIVAVGRLVEKKGFADLIDACGLLARRGRTFSCRIVGLGPLEADLRARLTQLGLQAQVELIGPRPQSEIIKEVQRAAVLAVPCVVGMDGDRDGLPNVLFEAMALGTPCISTNVTGIPEVVRDGETGLMVPQCDPEALAAAIERLLTNPALRVQLATQARRLIEAEFDIRRNAARRRALFQAADQVGVFQAGDGVGIGAAPEVG